jgi:hypothetical protein
VLGEYSQKRNRKIPPPHGPEPCHFKTALNGDFDSRSSGYAIFTGDYRARRAALRRQQHDTSPFDNPMLSLWRSHYGLKRTPLL